MDAGVIVLVCAPRVAGLAELRNYAFQSQPGGEVVFNVVQGSVGRPVETEACFLSAA